MQLARTAKAAAHTSRTLAQIFGTTTLVPKPLRRISEGFFAGATNPKGLIILTAMLPQFMDRAAGHVTLYIATFGAICIAMALLSDGARAIASAAPR